jgi:hypothetical protein
MKKFFSVMAAGCLLSLLVVGTTQLLPFRVVTAGEQTGEMMTHNQVSTRGRDGGGSELGRG